MILQSNLPKSLDKYEFIAQSSQKKLFLQLLKEENSPEVIENQTPINISLLLNPGAIMNFKNQLNLIFKQFGWDLFGKPDQKPPPPPPPPPDYRYFGYAFKIAHLILPHIDKSYLNDLKIEQMIDKIEAWEPDEEIRRKKGLDLRFLIDQYNKSESSSPSSEPFLIHFNLMNILCNTYKIHEIDGIGGKWMILYLTNILIDCTDKYYFSPGGGATSFSKIIDSFYHIITQKPQIKHSQYPEIEKTAGKKSLLKESGSGTQKKARNRN